MASVNSTGSQPPASTPKDDNTELIVAIAALVASAVALLIATLQALQQYFSSARGYTSCSQAVVGKWSKFTRRRLRASEFRFEVQFQVPVIFVARPTNTSGPLGDKEEAEIVRLDGSTESYLASLTPKPDEFDRDNARNRGKFQQIRTADNEGATWLALLMAVQRMESESGKWQEGRLQLTADEKSRLGSSPDRLSTAKRSKSSLIDKLLHSPTRRTSDVPRGELIGYSQPSKISNHSTGHQVGTSKKPGRSLIVCLQRKVKSWDSMPAHLSKPYAITTISHLVEIMAMLGIFWKEFNRDEHRYRAQGNGFILEGSYVDGLGITFTFQKSGPTWFEDNRVVPHRGIKLLCFGFAPTIFRGENDVVYADESMGRETLQLGSMEEIAQTLDVFGCNTTTVNYFRTKNTVARHSHFFPVLFEVLGMVGTVFQVPGTVFRMLPNPTIYHWDLTELSIISMISEFEIMLSFLFTSEKDVFKSADMNFLPEGALPSCLPSLVPSIKDVCKRLSQLESTDSDDNEDTVNKLGLSKGGAAAFPPFVLEALHNSIELCTNYLNTPELVPLVQLIFRAHIQEVLDMVNDEERIKQLDEADAESRPNILMGTYMVQLRKRIIDVVCKWLSMDPEQNKRFAAISHTVIRIGREPEELVNDIWCTLMVRMLCWLLLHDFHVKDVQVNKSELFQSRSPVYIA